MKIALIGYGKMGKEIERIAMERGHEIVLKIDINNQYELTVGNLKKADVAIEFTIPSSAIANYNLCFDAGIPVVGGTTGWHDRKEEVHNSCLSKDGTLFYASNFSVGMNIFFSINEKLAQLMGKCSGYKVEMKEIHHIQKLDAPSGTAITLAEGIIKNVPGKTKWVNQSTDKEDEVGIISEREGQVPGYHAVRYESEADTIEIIHNAKSRVGLALGAVLAAEFSFGKKGILGMSDLLNL